MKKKMSVFVFLLTLSLFSIDVYDESDQKFSILNGSITIFTPVSGSTFVCGEVLEITWYDNINENVKIDLYKYDEFLTNIVDSTLSDGTYLWRIPPSLLGEYFTVKVSSVDDDIISDISTGYFTINSNLSGVKMLYELTYDWNRTTSSWQEYPDRKEYIYLTNGNIESWDYLRHDGASYVLDKRYDCTYYADSYRLVNTYSTSSYHYSYLREDTYRYYLDDKFMARYIHETTMDETGYTSVITDKIYYYNGDNIKYIVDHVVVDNSYKKDSDTGQATYYFYDKYDRVDSTEYREWYTSSLLRRTNWVYTNQEGVGITEKLDGENWTDLSKNVHSYDQYGNLRKKENYNWENYEWVQVDEDSLYYFDGGLLQREIDFDYNSTSGEFTNNSKVEYYYNDPTVEIENGELIIENYTLEQNYPNPFNPETTISYLLINNAQVNLKVFDITGREIVDLVDSKQNKGSHEVKFDGSMLTSGIYFYQLSVDGKAVANRKMMLLK